MNLFCVRNPYYGRAVQSGAKPSSLLTVQGKIACICFLGLYIIDQCGVALLGTGLSGEAAHDVRCNDNRLYVRHEHQACFA